jgi:hypothetical protein
MSINWSQTNGRMTALRGENDESGNPIERSFLERIIGQSMQVSTYSRPHNGHLSTLGFLKTFGQTIDSQKSWSLFQSVKRKTRQTCKTQYVRHKTDKCISLVVPDYNEGSAGSSGIIIVKWYRTLTDIMFHAPVFQSRLMRLSSTL